MDRSGRAGLQRGGPGDVTDINQENRKGRVEATVPAPHGNRLREKLASGRTAFGQLVMEFFTAAVAPIASSAGLDFVIYDMEHGRCDIELLSAMAASARGSNLCVIARPPDASGKPLGRLLDLGANGLMVPRIQTRAQLEEVIAQTKYAPAGERGVALGIAHDRYRPQGPRYFEEANRDTVVIAILETAEAFENLDAIVSCPGLDVAWLGHYDLTASMGIPAQFDHPKFLEAKNALIAACKRHGVAAGFMPRTTEEFDDAALQGFRVLSLGSDLSNYVAAVDRFAQHAFRHEQR